MADGTVGLQIIDISNPANPTLIGTYNTSGAAYSVAVSGRYAYVVDYASGLQIIDISNPATPTLTGTYDTSGNALGIAVSGRYAYVADDASGLQIIDISNPATPTLTGTYDTSDYSSGIAVSGRYAYVADGGSGLQIIDISNPASPTLVGAYDTADYATGVTISGRYAYVTDGDLGLNVININGSEFSSLFAGALGTSQLAIDTDFTAGSNGIIRGGLNVGHDAMIGGVLTITGTASSSLLSSGTHTALAVLSGRVAIGTTSPLAKLDISTDSAGVTPHAVADELFLQSSGDTGLTIASGVAGSGNIFFADSGANNTGGIIYNHSLNSMAFGINNGTRMTIDSSGKVGIGTTTPSSKLQVYSSNSVTATPIVSIKQNSSGDAGIGFVLGTDNSYTMGIDNSDSDKFKLSYGSAANAALGTTDYLTVDVGGNVGIGTSNPTAALELYGSTQYSSALSDAGGRGGILALNDSNVTNPTGSGGAITFGNYSSVNAGSIGFAAIKGLLTSGAGNTTGDLAFSTRNTTGNSALTERMIIKANGKVGIGTSTPGYTLTVSGDISHTGALRYVNNDWVRFGAGSNGDGVYIGADGLTVIGAGESVGAVLADTSLAGGAETLWLTSDNQINFYTDYQNDGWASSTPTMTIGSDGALKMADLGYSFVTPAMGDILSIASTGGLQFDASNNALYIHESSTGAGASEINLRKARGTVDSPTTVVSGDDIAYFRGWAYTSGGTYDEAARIQFDTEGTITSSSTPGMIRFFTNDATTGDPTQRMTINSNGGVGIGDASPNEATLVVGSSGTGDIYFSPTTGSTTAAKALCWDNSGASLVFDCGAAPTADYAEVYATKPEVGYGHIVMATNEIVEQVDGHNSPRMTLATNTDNMLIGIAVNNYGDFTSTGHGAFASGEVTKPVALVGRVPVKVNLEGGNIAIGDDITVSSVSGVGKKATMAGEVVVGTALGVFDEHSTSDTVLVFVANKRHATNKELLRLALMDVDLEATSTDISSLIDNTDTIWNRLLTLADGFVDGVLSLIGIEAETIKTDTLCIGNTCVTENELIDLLNNAGQAPANTPPPSAPAEDDAITGDGTVADDVVTDDAPTEPAGDEGEPNQTSADNGLPTGEASGEGTDGDGTE